MDRVSDSDIAWLRQDSARSGTLGYAIPGGFEVYGALNLTDDAAATEDVLLAVLAPQQTDQLIAGWIDRGPWALPPGDEHVLFTGWRYRFRRVQAVELKGLPSQGEGSFPDLVFPTDRSWLVSLLWDDSWRSVGATNALARSIEQHLPTFERLGPDADLASTGRVPN